MRPEYHLWAEALQIENQQGENARVWIVNRIRELALTDDQAGVARLRAVATKLDQLTAEQRLSEPS